MDIFATLKQEHETVKGIFSRIEDTTDRAEKGRAELYELLKKELHSHTKAEQKTLYDKLKLDDTEKTMEDLLAEAEEEHHVVEVLLKELDGMDVTTVEWMAKVTVLRENVEHHVKEEESDMFKQARAFIDKEEAEELALEFKAEKEKILASM